MCACVRVRLCVFVCLFACVSVYVQAKTTRTNHTNTRAIFVVVNLILW